MTRPLSATPDTRYPEIEAAWQKFQPKYQPRISGNTQAAQERRRRLGLPMVETDANKRRIHFVLEYREENPNQTQLLRAWFHEEATAAAAPSQVIEEA